MFAIPLRTALTAFLLTGVLLTPVGVSPARGATEAEIKASIDRGIVYLRARMRMQRGGELGLTTLAMLKAGVPGDDRDVEAALSGLSGLIQNGTYTPVNHHRYEAGVTLMAFSSADPVRYKPQIEAIAKYLIEAQESHGGWHYPAGHAGVTAGSQNSGDTSITQYAMLGLWEATRAGIPVPKQVWDKAAAWHLATQLRDGSFTYHPSRTAVISSGTHSMAVAGTSSLLLARMLLFPDAKEIPLEEVEEETGPAAKAAKKKRTGIKYGILIPAPIETAETEAEAADAKARVAAEKDANYKPNNKLTSISNGAARGLRWMGTNFRIELSTQGQIGQQWNAYYLYGLERLAALSGLAEINGHDWYKEGSDFLLTRQLNDGSWNLDQAGVDPDTCFGVMFLAKATEKTLKKTPRRRREPKLGGGILVGARGLPDDLSQLQVGQVGAKPRKLKGAVDELLGELEKLDSSQIEAAQEAIVETILTEDPEVLVGQQDRLQKLSRDRRAEVRRTAVWALGRTNDLSAVPFILERLEDVDLSVIVEARNALRFMTRKPEFLELSETPTPEELADIVKQAGKWYLTVRPYSERDDLLEEPEAKP